MNKSAFLGLIDALREPRRNRWPGREIRRQRHLGRVIQVEKSLWCLGRGMRLGKTTPDEEWLGRIGRRPVQILDRPVSDHKVSRAFAITFSTRISSECAALALSCGSAGSAPSGIGICARGTSIFVPT